MVDEDDAVEVIEFVLYAYAHELVALHFEEFALEVLRLDGDKRRTLHFLIEAGQRQAAFFAFLDLFGVLHTTMVSVMNKIVFWNVVLYLKRQHPLNNINLI